MDLFFRITLNHECLDATVTSALGDPVAKAEEHQIVTFDCVKVRFADTSGLGLLVRLQARYPGRVQLLNIQPGLRRCLSKVTKDLLPPERCDENALFINPLSETFTLNPAGGLTQLEQSKTSPASVNINTQPANDRRALGLSGVLLKHSIRNVRKDDSRAHANHDEGFALSQSGMAKHS